MGILDKLRSREDGNKSLKSVKHHATKRRSTMSALMKRTLGSGDMASAVRLPPDEDLNDWLAANTVDFYNEVALLYGLCHDDSLRFTKPGEGFPNGFEYRWKSSTTEKPLRVSSPEFVDYVMTWVEDALDNPSIFPTMEADPFPEGFKEVYIADIFKKLFRVFAIIYHSYFKTVMEASDAVSHLNTVFKHFMFFAFEFQLIDPKEFRALQKPCDRLLEEFQRKSDKK